MTRRGRPPRGPEHAQKVEASEEARSRLELILRTLSGELSVAEACERLGIGEAQFHRLRDRALAGAAEALEPRPAGRPAAALDPSSARVAELEDELDELRIELYAAQVREELALVMPHVLQAPGEEGSKKRLS